jgi:predicted hotdog family 3-hydroxylacyl-ACP dehydratase
MPLDRQWIEQHIPHKGRMCLLDEVLSWDAARIRCRSTTHRAPDNPLRAHGRLGAACGIEYAAQAMAVHGALVAASAPLASTVSSQVRGSIGAAVGYLASVRNVALHVARLDDLPEELVAAAERVTGDGRTVLYEFTVSSGGRVLLTGRASIVFDAAFGAQPASTGTHA